MKRVWSWAATLLLAGCMQASAPTDAAVIPVPHWNIGDHWTMAAGNNTPEVTNESVVALPQAVLNGTAYDAVEVAGNSTAHSAGSTLFVNYVVWLRASDGALLQQNVTRTQITLAGMRALGVSTLAFDRPCPGYYGHRVGDAWTQPCAFTVRFGTGQGPAQVHHQSDQVRYRVLSRSELVVPAGSFSAFDVEANRTGAPLAHEFYAPAVCHDIRETAGRNYAVMTAGRCGHPGL
ncbi:MAG: hypothetical protein ACYDBQ_00575 [Thermoplasmatota archaeon]